MSYTPAATSCRDNQSSPSWRPVPLWASQAWICQLLPQHNLYRANCSVSSSIVAQPGISWKCKCKINNWTAKLNQLQSEQLENDSLYGQGQFLFVTMSEEVWMSSWPPMKDVASFPRGEAAITNAYSHCVNLKSHKGQDMYVQQYSVLKCRSISNNKPSSVINIFSHSGQKKKKNQIIFQLYHLSITYFPIMYFLTTATNVFQAFWDIPVCLPELAEMHPSAPSQT